MSKRTKDKPKKTKAEKTTPRMRRCLRCRELVPEDDIVGTNLCSWCYQAVR